MSARLGLGNLVLAQQIGDDRVVDGQQLERVTAQAVGSAVADVRHGSFAEPIEEQCDQRGAHTAEVVVS